MSLWLNSFAKINLALAVLGRRRDGYHEIRTVFQSIDISDRLELHLAGDLTLETSGLDGVPRDENLVWKAAQAAARAFGPGRGARIFLKKNIPAGSGLGSGSSNAAATLLGLCRLWRVAPPSGELFAVARELGSDVPFFLQGGTSLGIGRGDEVYPLPEPDPTAVVVVLPGIRVSTAEAYASLSFGLTPERQDHRIQDFCGRLQRPLACMTGFFNDFETSILPAYPAIREAKEFLIDRGAKTALLSGSGSSVFGFFLDEESALAACRAVAREGWRVLPAKTLSRSDYSQRMFG